MWRFLLLTCALTAALSETQQGLSDIGCRFSTATYLPVAQSGGCLGDLAANPRADGGPGIVLLVHDSGIPGRRAALESFYHRTVFRHLPQATPTRGGPGIQIRWFGAGTKKDEENKVEFAPRSGDDFLGVAEAFTSMLAEFPSATWFIKHDDDAILYVPNLVRVLEQIDHDRVRLCGMTSDLAFYGGFEMEYKLPSGRTVTYGSGGAGYVLSREALIRVNETGCLARAGAIKTPYEDVHMGLCAEGASVQFTPLLGMWPFSEDTLRCILAHQNAPILFNYCGISKHESLFRYDWTTMAPLSRHYLSPDQMYSIDIESAGVAVVSNRSFSDFDRFAVLHAHAAASFRQLGQFNRLKSGVPPKVLIYTPDLQARLSTRIMGLLNSFLLALVTGRAFIVDWRAEFKFPDDVGATTNSSDTSNVPHNLREILLPPHSYMEDWDVPLFYEHVVRQRNEFLKADFCKGECTVKDGLFKKPSRFTPEKIIGPRGIRRFLPDQQEGMLNLLATSDLDIEFREPVIVVNGPFVNNFTANIEQNPLYAARLARDFGASGTLHGLAEFLLVPTAAVMRQKQDILQDAPGGLFHVVSKEFDADKSIDVFQQTARWCSLPPSLHSGTLTQKWKSLVGDIRYANISRDQTGELSLVFALAFSENTIMSLRDDIGTLAFSLRPDHMPTFLVDVVSGVCTLKRPIPRRTNQNVGASLMAIALARSTSELCSRRPAFAFPAKSSQIQFSRSFVGQHQEPSYVFHTMMGRLGNELFQWASIQGIAASNGMQACFIDTSEIEPVFDTAPERCKRPTPTRRSSDGGLFGVHVDFQIQECEKDRDIMVTGYLQSFKYFPPDLRSELRFHRSVLLDASTFLLPYHALQRVLVGIHVRYTHQFDVNSGYLRFPPASYFYDAMHYFRSKYDKVQFIVVSDNSTWCASQPFFQGVDIHIITAKQASGLDLAILAACDHMVLSVGTFGWWAAFLGADASGGEVVYYADEFVMDHVEVKGRVEVDDYYPATWRAMGDRTLVQAAPSLFRPLHSSAVTLVTAFFPIQSKHSSAEYDTWTANFLTLKDSMVIFTSVDQETRMAEKRAHARAQTRIITAPLERSKMATDFNVSFWQRQHLIDPEKKAHADERLYIIWNEKTHWLKQAADMNVFNSTFFAWMDMGYLRTNQFNGKTMIRYVPTALLRNQVMILDMSLVLKAHAIKKRLPPPPRSLGGGFIGGFADGIRLWHRAYYEMLTAHSHEFIGKDQTWMWETCKKSMIAGDSLCSLVNPTSMHGDPWFFMAPFLHFGGTVEQSAAYAACPEKNNGRRSHRRDRSHSHTPRAHARI